MSFNIALILLATILFAFAVFDKASSKTGRLVAGGLFCLALAKLQGTGFLGFFGL